MNDGLDNHHNMKLVKSEAMDKKNFTSLEGVKSMSAKCKGPNFFA